MPSLPHVLVVDDDAEVREALEDYLSQRELRVSVAADGIEMKVVIADQPVDLVLLDLRLPGEDGLALTRYLKDLGGIAIIMVTGIGDPEDRVLGLETGADDYVVKPFNLRELLARIHSVLRRAGRPADLEAAASIRFGRWTYDTGSHQIRDADGGLPDLSAGEIDLLAILAEHADEAVSRDALLRGASHRDLAPFDRSVDVRIRRLRQKLEDDPAHPRFIRTVRNVGYLLRTDA